jgi:hypothetical protein
MLKSGASTLPADRLMIDLNIIAPGAVLQQ